MKNRDEQENSRWVEDRLAARLPDSQWQPNVNRGLAQFREQVDTKRAGAPRWAWLTAGVIVTSLSLAAFPATRMFAQRCVSACVSQSSRVEEFFTGSPATSTPRTVFRKPGDRMMAPEFTLSDASGAQVRLSDFRGKVVLLNFWATWCGPCKVEIPLLLGLQQEHRDQNFEILGVSLDEDGWHSVKPYMDEKKMTYRVMIGNAEIAHLYGGLDVIPATLIIDKSGRIAATHIGLCNKDEYEADIQAVLKEQ